MSIFFDVFEEVFVVVAVNGYVAVFECGEVFVVVFVYGFVEYEVEVEYVFVVGLVRGGA